MFLEIIALAAATQGSASATVKAPNPDKLICKKMGQTGSRLAANKVCLTRAQWEERARNDQRELNNMLKQPCAEQSCFAVLPNTGSIGRAGTIK